MYIYIYIYIMIIIIIIIITITSIPDDVPAIVHGLPEVVLGWISNYKYVLMVNTYPIIHS